MKNNKIQPSILPGFMELLPREQQIFKDIIRKITNVYEKNGFLEMDTPIIEKSEVLLAKSAGETEKQVYRFNRGSNDLSLRFDLTVPFARFSAQYFNELIFPFKRYQIGKVYRGERNQRGRYREFYQFDVDIIGNNKLSINNDALVISMASRAFKAIGLKDYKLQISNRKILSSVLKELEITNTTEVLILIDKYDKIGAAEFESSLIELIGKEKADYINKIININGSNEEILAELKKLDMNSEELKKGIEEIDTVRKMLKLLGVDDNEYTINLKIIRGLDYYTGTVIETFLIGNENYGSICSGGRYDNLAENYTDNILPGVGISIGLTRLFFVLKEIGFLDNYKVEKSIEYLIIPIGDTLEYCVEIYKMLLAKGKYTEIYLEEDKLKKKLNYANKLAIPNVILIGENEVLKREIKIKDMASGEEKVINLL
ncbi:histidine--tRNA ligase [Clostridium chromiireducens]|uniref:Histidine--tRNA ligase n=1 Tax=Clostridium chromiireducens TaxID=225345 RepID=A0A1V4IP63_9CLOT|nr:histidine--tRNA ligase [Clostridium chromiireducens]OPJ61595.1 histidine--tRNA ligase [Clostridium chromiireducens]RII34043.1 histidine--tRNA ligase [Clostridium chromiireducens]